MSNILGSLIIRLAADVSGFNSTMNTVEGRLAQTAQGMNSLGRGMTAGLTAPILGVGTAAVHAATQLNEGLANVASLGIATERVLEFKTAIQEMAIEVGKGTEDLTAGVYEVISSFGDSADTLEILKINAKGAAAGLATTQDAIKLTSAVTKAYGDTTAAAVQKTTDLAFQTVNLGQTTFPELARNMGQVTPIAVALGVTQEELWGQMATLTGVTGNTSEVATQLRATYQSILRPTTEMQGALASVAMELEQQGKLAGGPLVDAWRQASAQQAQGAATLASMRSELAGLNTDSEEGTKHAKALSAAIEDQEKAVKEQGGATETAAAALGSAVVKSAGLNDTLDMLNDTTGGNTNTLAKMLGSVEALTAVLALSGSQAETAAIKYKAMTNVAGVTDAAFAAQTEGLNAAGFTMKQVAVKAEVLLQKLGDGLAPALGKLLTLIEPLVDWAAAWADWFAKADTATQNWIVTIAGIAAAAGPVLLVISGIVTAVSGIVGLVSGVVGFVGAMGSMVGIFGAAGVIASGLISSLGAIGGALLTLATGPIGLTVLAVTGLVAAWSTNFLGIQDITYSVMGAIGSFLKSAWDGIGARAAALWDGLRKAFGVGWDMLKSATSSGVTAVGDYWQAHKGALAATASALWEGTKSAFAAGWEAIKGLSRSGLQGVAGYWQAHSSEMAALAGAQFEAIKGVFGVGFTALQGATKAGAQFINGDWEGGMATLRSTAQSVMEQAKSIFGSQMQAIEELFALFGWRDIGENITRGIADGIMASISWIQGAAQQAAQSALDAAKNLLGIHSPSRVAAEQLGLPFAQGFGVGAQEGMGDLLPQFEAGFQGLMGGLQPAGVGAGGYGATATITQNFYGDADPAMVRNAGRDGVLAGLRQRGVR